MNIKDESILFFTRTMGQGGTENVVLQLCEIIKPIAKKTVVCSCGGVNEKILNDLGIKHYTVPDITVKKPSAMIQVIRSLRSIVREEKITVIHSHHRMAAFYAQFAGGHVVKLANAHNTFNDKKSFTKFAYRNTSIIAVGEQVKKNLTDVFQISEGNITVIHNTVKPFDSELTVIPELKSAKEAGYALIGNVGRISEQKGMEYFVEAAALVFQITNKVRFYIIGSGEEEEKIKKLAEEKLPDNAITFMGYRNDIQNVMSQLDFVVLSSLWEGFPLTPIEAFSVGKTIIATAVDGTPEIVVDGENGLLVEPRDVDELAKKMMTLLNDRTLLQRLEANAKKSYEENFSFMTYSNQVIEYYEKILALAKGR